MEIDNVDKIKNLESQLILASHQIRGLLKENNNLIEALQKCKLQRNDHMVGDIYKNLIAAYDDYLKCILGQV